MRFKSCLFRDCNVYLLKNQKNVIIFLLILWYSDKMFTYRRFIAILFKRFIMMKKNTGFSLFLRKAVQATVLCFFVLLSITNEVMAAACAPAGASSSSAGGLSSYGIDPSAVVFGVINQNTADHSLGISGTSFFDGAGTVLQESAGNGFRSVGILNSPCSVSADGRVMLNVDAPPTNPASKAAAASKLNECIAKLEDVKKNGEGFWGGDWNPFGADTASAIANLEKNFPTLTGAMDQMVFDDPDTKCGYYVNPKHQYRYFENQKNTCWFCDPFNYVLQAIDDVATRTYGQVKNGVLSVLTILFALWLVYQVMINVTITHAKDQGEFYTTLGKGCVRAFFGAAMIAAGKDLWDLVVTPFSAGAFDYAAAVLPDFNGSATGASTPFEAVQKVMIGGCQRGKTEGGMLSTINKSLMSLFAIGKMMFFGSLYKGSETFCLPMNYWHIFIASLPILLTALYLLFAVPLKLLDALFRLGIVLILLPIFILTWVFPSSRGFTRRGFNMFLNAILTFLIMAIVVSLLIQLITSGLKIADITITEKDGFPFDDLAKGLADMFGETFFLLLAYMFFSFAVLNTVSAIAGSLSDTGFQDTSGKPIGSMIMRGGKGVGVAALAAAGLGGAIVKKAGQSVFDNSEQQASTLKDTINQDSATYPIPTHNKFNAGGSSGETSEGNQARAPQAQSGAAGDPYGTFRDFHWQGDGNSRSVNPPQSAAGDPYGTFRDFHWKGDGERSNLTAATAAQSSNTAVQQKGVGIAFFEDLSSTSRMPYPVADEKNFNQVSGIVSREESWWNSVIRRIRGDAPTAGI